ncbi:MAG: sulfatase, partial [Planctomycetota bacterium]
MTRREAIAALSAAGVGLVTAGVGRGRPMRDVDSAPGRGDVRHVCFLFMEDMGLQCGPYGDRTVPTPALDRLASMGCTFDRAYCTSATCSPSRSSIFTGLWPHQNGHVGLADGVKEGSNQWGWRLHEGMPTLNPMLRDLGFSIGRTYKLHVGPEDANPFDAVYQWQSFQDAGRGMNHGAQIAAFMRDFYGQHVGDDGRMFFIPQSIDTHRPFAWKGGGHNASLEYDGSPYRVMTAADDLMLPHFGPDIPRPQNLCRDVADYYNAVQRVDRTVDETLDALETLGILDETLIVFSADHGPPFTRGKLSVYELGARVPLIVRWPGVSRAGSREARPVSLVDFMPTVLDAVGLPIPEYMPGRSWRGLLDGSADDWPEFAVSEYTTHMTVKTWWPSRTITDGRWKLNLHMLAGTEHAAGDRPLPDNPPDFRVGINAPEGTVAREIYRRFNAPPRFELFDLASDPYEYHSLHDDPRHAGQMKRLQAALERWQLETHDPFRDEAYLAAYTDHYKAK